MRFKQTPDEIKWKIHAAAQEAANVNLSGLGYGGAADQLKYALSSAIANAVAEGIKVMMQNAYTDEDFEKDIGLK